MNSMSVYFRTVFLLLLFAAFVSCTEDLSPPQFQYGSLVLNFEQSNWSANSKMEENSIKKVTHMVITVKGMDGRETDYSARKVEVYEFEGAYLSGNMLLPVGTYQITTLYLVDGGENVLFAVPQKELLLSQNVDNPLPISDVSSTRLANNVKVEVLSTKRLTPEDFGLESLEVKFEDVFYFFVALVDKTNPGDFLPGSIEVSNGEYMHQQDIDSQIQKINLKPGYENYSIEIQSEDYQHFEGSFSYDSLLSHDATPLVIELKRVNECVGGTYVGNVVLNTQQEVDDFGRKCYTKIEGRLRIGSPKEPLAIKDLGHLESLTIVTGSVEIRNNKGLTSLHGLHHLSSVGSYMAIDGNEILESLADLRNLTSIAHGLEITNNNALTNLDGMQGLSSLSSNSQINENQNLISLEGLENLKTVSFLFINSNRKLISFKGLNNLTNVGGLSISGNSSLTSFSGSGNSISSLNNLYIINNPLLTDFKGLMAADGEVKDALTIDNNASLVSLEGLKFQNDIVFFIEIKNNPQLLDISAMSSINTIGRDLTITNNEKLPHLTGLENLFSVGNLYGSNNSYLLSIVNNPSLKDFCALSYLFQEGILYKQNIALNAYNPSAAQMKADKCAL
jgi:hypothetical protein